MADASIAEIAFRRCSRCRLWKRQSLHFFYFSAKRQAWSSRCRPCSIAAAQERYFANPEPIREYARRLYRADPGRTYARVLQWNADNPERSRELARGVQKRLRAKLRAELLAAYGHRCACCGLSEFSEFLTLEHVRRDGLEHRRRLGGQVEVFKELKRLGWPTDGYTLLCWNCQATSWYGGVCAHHPDHRLPQPRHRMIREAVITAYGGVCVCCGLGEHAFLTIHHSDKDGKEHRRRVGSNVYQDLRRRGFPDEGITLLCYNCHMAETHYGCCPHERGKPGPADPGIRRRSCRES